MSESKLMFQNLATYAMLGSTIAIGGQTCNLGYLAYSAFTQGHAGLGIFYSVLTTVLLVVEYQAVQLVLLYRRFLVCEENQKEISEWQRVYK